MSSVPFLRSSTSISSTSPVEQSTSSSASWPSLTHLFLTAVVSPIVYKICESNIMIGKVHVFKNPLGALAVVVGVKSVIERFMQGSQHTNSPTNSLEVANSVKKCLETIKMGHPEYKNICDLMVNKSQKILNLHNKLYLELSTIEKNEINSEIEESTKNLISEFYLFIGHITTEPFRQIDQITQLTDLTQKQKTEIDSLKTLLLSLTSNVSKGVSTGRGDELIELQSAMFAQIEQIDMLKNANRTQGEILKKLEENPRSQSKSIDDPNNKDKIIEDLKNENESLRNRLNNVIAEHRQEIKNFREEFNAEQIRTEERLQKQINEFMARFPASLPEVSGATV